MAKARKLVPLLAFLSYVPAVMLAQQQPSQSGARYTLRGSVVNSVTGEPIRKALVEANGHQQKTIFTGPDGQFQFEGEPAGDYYMVARRQGYADRSMMGHQIYPVTLGSDTGPVVLKLDPLARISGRVLDTEGEPVPNLTVICHHLMFQQGHKSWQQSQQSSTDESGNFLIDSLLPGSYVVSTAQLPVYPGMFTDDQASRLIYRQQYFPNSPDFSGAQLIQLAPGEDSRADIAVSTVEGRRVFLAVTPPQPWVRATLSNEAGDQRDLQLRPNPRTGGWVLPIVPPGAWRLQLESNNNNEVLSGETTIEVGQTDLKNVVVALSPRLPVPVVFTANLRNGSPPANVQLLSAAGSINFNVFSNMSSPVVEENHFPIVGVPPGTYHVQANAGGEECVESITSGASDLTRVDYIISGEGAPQPINIALRTDCASLEISTAQQPNQPFALVLVGGPSTLEPQTINLSGKYTLKVTPGDYQLFAFSDINSIEYANPEVLRNYTGQHVSVGPNQTETVRIEVINTGETR